MPNQSQKATVLAVDDTPENLDVVRGILGDDYVIKAATSGKMALKIVAKSAPDLILLDVMMPEMDGYEVCRRLKSDAATRDIPVIFVTAMDQTMDEEEGFQQGAADYITKPVRPAILKARVGTHLALKKSMDELQSAYALIKQHSDKMEDELNVGRDIQMSMVPAVFPPYPERSEFNLHAALRPARQVGGDFYDFFFVDEKRICLVIGDVSGKGVPAALFMAVTKTMIKAQAATDPSPASLMTRVNSEIASDNPESMFVTIFLAIMNVKTGEVAYTNAGHNPPYVLSEDGEVRCIRDRHGPVVGAVPGLAYKESSLVLGKGDVLFTYTDGVTEAMNEQSELYSDATLEKLLGTLGGKTLPKVVEAVIESVDEFAGTADQADDITLLVAQNTAPGTSSASASLRVEMTNDLPEIARVINDFHAFAETNNIPTAVARRAKLVFDELLNNIVSYAYPEGGDHRISVQVELFNERLTFIFIDDGIPFNPFARAAPDTNLSLEEREIGGLGIHLVHKLMDRVSYERRVDQNVTTLVKKLENQAD